MSTADLYNAQDHLGSVQGRITQMMSDLAQLAQNETDTKELQEIQLKIDDLKRKYDVLESISETLKGAQESASKFAQSR